jgi:hypothetical protein
MRFFERLFTAHQWMVFVYWNVLAGVLLLMAGFAASAASAWVAFTVAGSAGVVAALAYTEVLRRRGHLFLRNRKAIARNRRRIQRVSIPLGYALGGAGLIVYKVGPPSLKAVVFSLWGGVLLGFLPSLTANYLRLRREGLGKVDQAPRDA